MARMVAIDGDPSLGVQEGALGPAAASRWSREKAMSPPRIRRPSRVMPSVSEREREETPAIAATPSAMQARKMPKPLQAAAQLAQGEAQQERQAGGGGRPALRRGGKGAVHER